jgi:hypothetical protein
MMMMTVGIRRSLRRNLLMFVAATVKKGGHDESFQAQRMVGNLHPGTPRQMMQQERNPWSSTANLRRAVG